MLTAALGRFDQVLRLLIVRGEFFLLPTPRSLPGPSFPSIAQSLGHQSQLAPMCQVHAQGWGTQSWGGQAATPGSPRNMWGQCLLGAWGTGTGGGEHRGLGARALACRERLVGRGAVGRRRSCPGRQARQDPLGRWCGLGTVVALNSRNSLFKRGGEERRAQSWRGL